jgi:putative ABC transport system permease protein
MRPVMDFMPILSALKRNKVGAMLVALQIALTLAVLANALSIIGHHLTDMARPSGMDEPNIFSMSNQWLGKPDDLRARIETDVSALRSLPGVIDVEATNSFPLSGNFFIGGIRKKQEQTAEAALTSLYMDTVHGLAAQGLKLSAGRWFAADEIGEANLGQVKDPPSVVLTAPLARQLFPDGHALGQAVYLNGDSPVRVVGIVERASSASGGTIGNVDFSTFLPMQSVNTFVVYVVRTQPRQQPAVMAAARRRLLDISRMRVLSGIEPFSERRKELYAVAAATSGLLATASALLLIITACGTVGMTMLWVAQRRRQIGTRRALGARRIDILRYFHSENLLISSAGALLGIAAGLGANLWLAKHLAMARMSPLHIVVGALVVLCLSQLAVLWPAMRAATVPPSLAARGL